MWLQQWAQGDPAALDHLAPLVYDRLRIIAENLLRNEPADHTLQPTALVSETFLKLLDLHTVTLNDRSHFFAFAARLMRRLLIDHARRLKAAKRSLARNLPLDSELAWTSSLSEQSLDLSVALEELEVLGRLSPRDLVGHRRRLGHVLELEDAVAFVEETKRVGCDCLADRFRRRRRDRDLRWCLAEKPTLVDLPQR